MVAEVLSSGDNVESAGKSVAEVVWGREYINRPYAPPRNTRAANNFNHFTVFSASIFPLFPHDQGLDREGGGEFPEIAQVDFANRRLLDRGTISSEGYKKTSTVAIRP